MATATLKLSFVLANVVAVYASYTPPNAPPDSKDISTYAMRTDTKDAVSSIVWIAIPTLRHDLPRRQLLSTTCPDLPVVQYLGDVVFPSNAKPLSPLNFYPSTPFVCGSLVMYVSTYLRLLCFRTLRRHFTLELSFQKDHKLITSGPYAVVRHPSYLAATCLVGAMAIVAFFSPGTWWWESGMWHTWQGQLFGGLWLALSAVIMWMLLMRVPKEDLMLRTEFKEKWVDWKRKTPYAVIPSVW
ncbi:hypothetical protein EIP91_008599 [Steccherinum ochraceum]|uniref:Protein-S-isoprenylcysteine O-methyltransferase n=1 Tax=Steccherinum ochraceum TaxID=92696 RepID=A0A4R0RPN8_9APHY|nr:hypothetical protein EIP91_008599 [Steccherinum ochraceum]